MGPRFSSIEESLHMWSFRLPHECMGQGVRLHTRKVEVNEIYSLNTSAHLGRVRLCKGEEAAVSSLSV